jgi:hypothetical protein
VTTLAPVFCSIATHAPYPAHNWRHFPARPHFLVSTEVTGQPSAQEQLALALNVAKLSIAIGMLLPFFGLVITLQTVA